MWSKEPLSIKPKYESDLWTIIKKGIWVPPSILSRTEGKGIEKEKLKILIFTYLFQYYYNTSSICFKFWSLILLLLFYFFLDVSPTLTIDGFLLIILISCMLLSLYQPLLYFCMYLSEYVYAKINPSHA